jgi:tetratricopeptide (TPR) repeat protein
MQGFNPKKMSMMKWLCNGAAVLICLVPVFGCAPQTSTTPSADRPMQRYVEYSPAHENGDRFYYFLESQLQRRQGDLDKAIYFMQKAIANAPNAFFLKKELAALYLRERNPEKAVGLIEEMLEADPESVEILILFGKLKQGMKQYEDARKAYQRVLELDPDQKEIYLRLGALYLEEEDLENAYEVYEGLVERFPDSYVGHFFLGKIHAERGELEAAEKKFRTTLDLEPDLEEPQFELLSIYETQGKNQKIIRIYQDILEEEPENIRAEMGLGYFYHSIGMTRSAEKLLTRVGEQSRSNEEVIRTLIQLYIDPKKYEAAVIILEGMLKGAPDSSDLHYVAGVAYDGINDEERMLHHLKQVKPDSRFYQNAVVHIAFLYQENGQVRKAIDFLEGVIRKVPDNTDFYIYLGAFYEEIEEYAKAEAALKKGLEADPDNPRIYFRLGVVYDKWDRKADSIEIMKKVIELDPKNANALNYLGYTYADMGENLDEAERLIQEALKYKPDDGYILDSMGWVYYQKGEYEKALAYLEKAVDLVSDDPIILEHVGDIHIKLNNPEKALEYYRRSLSHRKTEEEKSHIEQKIRELTEPGTT